MELNGYLTNHVMVRRLKEDVMADTLRPLHRDAWHLARLLHEGALRDELESLAAWEKRSRRSKLEEAARFVERSGGGRHASEAAALRSLLGPFVGGKFALPPEDDDGGRWPRLKNTSVVPPPIFMQGGRAATTNPALLGSRRGAELFSNAVCGLLTGLLWRCRDGVHGHHRGDPAALEAELRDDEVRGRLRPELLQRRAEEDLRVAGPRHLHGRAALALRGDALPAPF